MEQPNVIEQRLTELEIKASFTEDLLDQLNQTIYRQQQQIELLLHVVAELRRQVPEASQPALSGPRDEPPPHY